MKPDGTYDVREASCSRPQHAGEDARPRSLEARARGLEISRTWEEPSCARRLIAMVERLERGGRRAEFRFGAPPEAARAFCRRVLRRIARWQGSKRASLPSPRSRRRVRLRLRSFARSALRIGSSSAARPASRSQSSIDSLSSKPLIRAPAFSAPRARARAPAQRHDVALSRLESRPHRKPMTNRRAFVEDVPCSPRVHRRHALLALEQPRRGTGRGLDLLLLRHHGDGENLLLGASVDGGPRRGRAPRSRHAPCPDRAAGRRPSQTRSSGTT